MTFAILIVIMLFSRMLKLSILFIYNNKCFWRKILSHEKYLICQNEDIKFSFFWQAYVEIVNVLWQWHYIAIVKGEIAILDHYHPQCNKTEKTMSTFYYSTERSYHH